MELLLIANITISALLALALWLWGFRYPMGPA